MRRSLIFFGSCGLVLAGLALADVPSRLIITDTPWLVIAPVVCTTALALWLVWLMNRDRVTQWVIAGMLLLGFGLMWGLVGRIRIDPGPLPYGQTVEITGTVVDFPELYARRQEVVIATSSLGPPTRIMLSAGRFPELRRGMVVRVSGPLVEPKDTPDFAEARWLFGKGIYGRIRFPDQVVLLENERQPWSIINQFRTNASQVFVTALPEPAASLALGLVLGTTPRIDTELSDNLRRTNLTHLAAVSGQNITLTIFVLFRLLRRYFLRGAIGVSLGLLLFYVMVTGADASVVRAAIMAGLLLLGLLVGRPSNGLRGLVLAALCIGLVNPAAVTHDIGFGLSFFALSGILLIGPSLERILHFVPETLRIIVATTVSASLGVLPLQLVAFGSVSLVGVVANTIVGPLVPIAMGGAFILVAVSLINEVVGQGLALVVYPVMAFIQTIASALGSWELAQVEVAIPRAANLPIMLGAVVVWLVLVIRQIQQPVPPWTEGDV